MGDWDATPRGIKPSSTVDGTDGDWKNLTERFDGLTTSGDLTSEMKISDGLGSDNPGCRNCGLDGHFARDCPEPKKMTGECFNCGEVGHNKADCPNPRVERAFTGECRYCQKAGHMAKDCPEKGPVRCQNCGVEGAHKTSECSSNRKIDRSQVQDMTDLQAWEMLKAMGKTRDIDDFKEAVQVYCKACPGVTYPELEKMLRDATLNFHIIALEKDIPPSMVLVNLQGESKMKYTVGYFLSAEPQRIQFKEIWPSSSTENMKRLEEAGEPMPNFQPLCRRCNELGHISKSCPQERVEHEQPKFICSNCNEEGHRLRDCEQPRVSRGSGVCRNCQQPGHKAVDCPEPRSAAEVECRRCNETGHFAKDCPNNTARQCRNCGSTEHLARDCDQPKNPDSMICRNCDKPGHMSRECPEPKDWSRVKCSNCGEMGHTKVRCTQPVAIENETNTGFGDNFPGSSNTAAAEARPTGGLGDGLDGLNVHAETFTHGGWENGETGTAGASESRKTEQSRDASW